MVFLTTLYTGADNGKKIFIKRRKKPDLMPENWHLIPGECTQHMGQVPTGIEHAANHSQIKCQQNYFLKFLRNMTRSRRSTAPTKAISTIFQNSEAKKEKEVFF